MLEAIEAARPGSRGKPLEQVKARLIDELRKRDAFLSPSMVEWHARHMAVPGWALRHPLRARRLLREGRDQSKAAESEVDSIQARLERVIDRELDVAVTMSSVQTMDGVRHEVLIDPWSEELARRLRASVAPTPVEVRPQRGR